MAPTPEPPTTIALKVKVPPGYIQGSSDDFSLGSLAVTSTIGAVRLQLQQLFPSHPSPDKQRILYAGRALVDDAQTLADALNTKRDPSQTEYVVHLLVRAEHGGSGSIGSGASLAQALGQGHRRGVSIPGTPATTATTARRSGSEGTPQPPSAVDAQLPAQAQQPFQHGNPAGLQPQVPGLQQQQINFPAEMFAPHPQQQVISHILQQLQAGVPQQGNAVHLQQLQQQQQQLQQIMQGLHGGGAGGPQQHLPPPHAQIHQFQQQHQPRNPQTPQPVADGQDLPASHPPSGTPAGQAPPGVPNMQGGVRAGMPGFGQAVVQGQQQRAAMGMHGIGDQVPTGTQMVGDVTQNSREIRSGTPADQRSTNPTDQAEQAQQGTASQQLGQVPGPTQGPNLQQQPPQHVQRPPGRPMGQHGFHIDATMEDGRRVQIHQQAFHNGAPVQGLPFPLPPGLHFPMQPGLPFPMQPGLPFPMQPRLPGFMPQVPGLQLPQGNQPLVNHQPVLGFPPQQQQQQQQPQQQQQGQTGGTIGAAGRSALDRARDNVEEMQRMLDEMRNSAGTDDEAQRTRISTLQDRVRALNNYIDPFALGRPAAAATPAAGVPPSAPSAVPLQRQGNPSLPDRAAYPALFPPGPRPPFPQGFFPVPHAQRQQQQQQARPSPNDVMCYLLSSPQGPQFLLVSPQYGVYTNNRVTGSSPVPSPPTPTPTTQPAEQVQPAEGGIPAGQQALDRLAAHAQGDPVAAAAAQHVANGQAANDIRRQQFAQAQEPAGALQGLMNHMWLLLRLLIFAYFLLGSNMGWRRPIALLLIGFGFWMVRMGLFGEGGVARRWWDGVVRIGPPPAEVGQAAQADGAPAQGAGAQARTPMPTPEQVAQRLLDQRNERQNARMQQVREWIRPAERAVALFVASLWPGIGEAHVRAREEEERRVRGEEGRRVREVEEERVRREEEEKRSEEVGGEGGQGDSGTTKVEGGMIEGVEKADEDVGGKASGATKATGAAVADGSGGEQRADTV